MESYREPRSCWHILIPQYHLVRQQQSDAAPSAKCSSVQAARLPGRRWRVAVDTTFVFNTVKKQMYTSVRARREGVSLDSECAEVLAGAGVSARRRRCGVDVIFGDAFFSDGSERGWQMCVRANDYTKVYSCDKCLGYAIYCIPT